MRAVALHADVLVATSAVLGANCVIVRGGNAADGAARGGGEQGAASRGVAASGEVAASGDAASGGVGAESAPGETFVIDSPILPDELEALPALVEQARFPAPAALLATHGDWDHLLGRLAFPGLALGSAPSTLERLQSSPGAVQRELRAFDEKLLIERQHPLALGSLQPLPVPGRCALGDHELELHPAVGHTGDGMAVLASWAGVLVAGDYLSAVTLPDLRDGGSLAEYLATLERLRGLLAACEHVVPGHGPVLDAARASVILAEDIEYLQALSQQGERAQLPAGQRGQAQRLVHEQNVAHVIREACVKDV